MKAGDNNLQLPEDPMAGLLLWLKEAQEAGLPEPNAMTLATVSGEGRPSARIVLFKGMESIVKRRERPAFFHELRKSQIARARSKSGCGPRVSLECDGAPDSRRRPH